MRHSRTLWAVLALGSASFVQALPAAAAATAATAAWRISGLSPAAKGCVVQGFSNAGCRESLDLAASFDDTSLYLTAPGNRPRLRCIQLQCSSDALVEANPGLQEHDLESNTWRSVPNAQVRWADSHRRLVLFHPSVLGLHPALASLICITCVVLLHGLCQIPTMDIYLLHRAQNEEACSGVEVLRSFGDLFGLSVRRYRSEVLDKVASLCSSDASTTMSTSFEMPSVDGYTPSSLSGAAASPPRRRFSCSRLRKPDVVLSCLPAHGLCLAAIYTCVHAFLDSSWLRCSGAFLFLYPAAAFLQPLFILPVESAYFGCADREYACRIPSWCLVLVMPLALAFALILEATRHPAPIPLLDTVLLVSVVLCLLTAQLPPLYSLIGDVRVWRRIHRELKVECEQVPCLNGVYTLQQALPASYPVWMKDNDNRDGRKWMYSSSMKWCLSNISPHSTTAANAAEAILSTACDHEGAMPNEMSEDSWARGRLTAKMLRGSPLTSGAPPAASAGPAAMHATRLTIPDSPLGRADVIEGGQPEADVDLGSPAGPALGPDALGLGRASSAFEPVTVVIRPCMRGEQDGWRETFRSILAKEPVPLRNVESWLQVSVSCHHVLQHQLQGLYELLLDKKFREYPVWQHEEKSAFIYRHPKQDRWAVGTLPPEQKLGQDFNFNGGYLISPLATDGELPHQFRGRWSWKSEPRDSSASQDAGIHIERYLTLPLLGEFPGVLQVISPSQMKQCAGEYRTVYGMTSYRGYPVWRKVQGAPLFLSCARVPPGLRRSAARQLIPKGRAVDCLWCLGPRMMQEEDFVLADAWICGGASQQPHHIDAGGWWVWSEEQGRHDIDVNIRFFEGRSLAFLPGDDIGHPYPYPDVTQARAIPRRDFQYQTELPTRRVLVSHGQRMPPELGVYERNRAPCGQAGRYPHPEVSQILAARPPDLQACGPRRHSHGRWFATKAWLHKAGGRTSQQIMDHMRVVHQAQEEEYYMGQGRRGSLVDWLRASVGRARSRWSWHHDDLARQQPDVEAYPQMSPYFDDTGFYNSEDEESKDSALSTDSEVRSRREAEAEEKRANRPRAKDKDRKKSKEKPAEERDWTPENSESKRSSEKKSKREKKDRREKKEKREKKDKKEKERTKEKKDAASGVAEDTDGDVTAPRRPKGKSPGRNRGKSRTTSASAQDISLGPEDIAVARE